MNIDELFQELIKLNINASAKLICRIWGMDEAAFSRKKKAGTQIKLKNIEQLENAFEIKLTQKGSNQLFMKKKLIPETKTIKGFGRKLQKLRAENDLTIARFSKITGINEDTIVDYVNGDKEPDLQDLIKIVNNFNITIDELLF